MNSGLFLTTVLEKFYEHLHHFEEDNYDLNRFKKEDEKVFKVQPYLLPFMQFFIERYEGFYKTYALLKDENSRELYIRLILFRILGHMHVRVKDRGWSDFEALLEKVKPYNTGKSKFDAPMLHLTLDHYDNYPYRGHQLALESVDINLVYTFLLDMYRYESGGVTIDVEPGDYVIDAGTCAGETTVKFAALAGKKGRVFGFDPLPLHLAITRHSLAQNGYDDFTTLWGYGVSDRTQGEPDDLVDHANVIKPGFSIEKDPENIPTIRIDDFMGRQGIEKMDFIKMDIEGSELAALKGAEETIRKHRPKLAISLYHKIDDYITIPQYLTETFPFYDFYLDHYTLFMQETVLYAVADK